MLIQTADGRRLAANKAAVREHYDAVVNAFDAEAVRAQVADDFFDHQANKPMTADEVIAHARALQVALGDLHVTIDDIIAEGDRVAVRATWRGIHRGVFRGLVPTGKQVTFTGMVFWRLRDGRVAERWATIDFGDLASTRG